MAWKATETGRPEAAMPEQTATERPAEPPATELAQMEQKTDCRAIPSLEGRMTE